jgi:hypothetical protein
MHMLGEDHALVPRTSTAGKERSGMTGHNLFSAYFLTDNGWDHTEKACVASHLAKMAHGQSRQWLYDQKNAQICKDIEAHPEDFLLSYFDGTGLIGVRQISTGQGLHLPLSEITAGARAVLIAHLARALSLPQGHI